MVSSLDYINNGKLLTTNGDVRVYEFNDELFMESGIKGNLISAENDLRNYIWQLGKKPHGDVLILGLGLGFSIKYLLSLPKINSITVIEPNNNIIIMYQQSQQHFESDIPITVINSDFFKYLYETKDNFDFVFIDCYRRMDHTTWPLVADLVVAARHSCKVNGKITGWVDDGASEYWINAFQTLF